MQTLFLSWEQKIMKLQLDGARRSILILRMLKMKILNLECQYRVQEEELDDNYEKNSSNNVFKYFSFFLWEAGKKGKTNVSERIYNQARALCVQICAGCH